MYYDKRMTLTIELEEEEEAALFNAYETLLKLNEKLKELKKDSGSVSYKVQFENSEDEELIDSFNATVKRFMKELSE